MKAPDKIYVNEWGIWFNEPDGITDVAYIRKDALVKWLQDAVSDITGINYEESNYEAGQADAFWDVIEHINEM